MFYLQHILPTLGAIIYSKNEGFMHVYNNAETCKQSGRNCSKHQQCDGKDVGKICFENRSNLKQYQLTIYKNDLPCKENTTFYVVRILDTLSENWQ